LTIEKFFDKENLNALARECKFVKRTSKISGALFLQALVLNNLDFSSLTLQEVCCELSATYGITISKQGIDQRFNQEAVSFLKRALEQRIASQANLGAYKDMFAPFTGVRIKDSTKFVAPDNLAGDFACNGMGGHKAGIKISYEFDLKTGKIIHLELFSANVQDLTDAQTTVDDIGAGELIIRDLGYIVTDVLQKIDLKKAFFINRLHSNVMVFEQDKQGDYHELDYMAICKQMKRNHLQRIEKEVLIGGKQRYKVRMIIEQLPQVKINERMHKLKEAGKRKGYTPSELAKAKASINVYVTNTSPKIVEADKIRSYYSLRWQIELMFKIWKSTLNIHQLKVMNQARYLCHLFAKLIWVCISFTIFRFVCRYGVENDAGQISMLKTLKHLKIHLKTMVLATTENRKRQLSCFVVSALKYWRLENKKGKIGLEKTMGSVAHKP